MTQARNRRAQIGQVFAGWIECSGVGGLQQTRRQARFGADDFDDLSQARRRDRASALRIRMTTSGKQGRFTVPFDTSVAKFLRNSSAETRSSPLVAADLESANGFDATGFGVAAAVF